MNNPKWKCGECGKQGASDYSSIITIRLCDSCAEQAGL